MLQRGRRTPELAGAAASEISRCVPGFVWVLYTSTRVHVYTVGSCAPGKKCARCLYGGRGLAGCTLRFVVSVFVDGSLHSGCAECVSGWGRNCSVEWGRCQFPEHGNAGNTLSRQRKAPTTAYALLLSGPLVYGY